MSDDRVKAGFWARALIRQVNSQYGSAMLIKRGDEDAGAVLVVLIDRKEQFAILREAASGRGWDRVAMESRDALNAYLERQKGYDPDLWILEFELDDTGILIEETLPGRRG